MSVLLSFSISPIVLSINKSAVYLGPIDISKLKTNYSYYFKSESKLVKIDLDGLPVPDEFWSEEELAQ